MDLFNFDFKIHVFGATPDPPPLPHQTHRTFNCTSMTCTLRVQDLLRYFSPSTSQKLIIWLEIKSYYIYSVGTFKTSKGEHLQAKSRQGHFFQSKQTQRGTLLSYQDCYSNLPLASILLKMFLILSDAVDIFPSRRKKKSVL